MVYLRLSCLADEVGFGQVREVVHHLEQHVEAQGPQALPGKHPMPAYLPS